MTFRLPQNLTSQLQVETGASVLKMELMGEHAAAIGFHGRRVEKAMAAWESLDTSDAHERDQCLETATTAVYNYFIQREALGLNNHDFPTRYYRIPGVILARLGAKRG